MDRRIERYATFSCAIIVKHPVLIICGKDCVMQWYKCYREQGEYSSPSHKMVFFVCSVFFVFGLFGSLKIVLINVALLPQLPQGRLQFRVVRGTKRKKQTVVCLPCCLVSVARCLVQVLDCEKTGPTILERRWQHLMWQKHCCKQMYVAFGDNSIKQRFPQNSAQNLSGKSGTVT